MSSGGLAQSPQPSGKPEAPTVLYGTEHYKICRFKLQHIKQQMPPDKQSAVDVAIDRFRQAAMQLPANQMGFQQLLRVMEQVLVPILGARRAKEQTNLKPSHRSSPAIQQSNQVNIQIANQAPSDMERSPSPMMLPQHMQSHANFPPGANNYTMHAMPMNPAQHQQRMVNAARSQGTGAVPGMQTPMVPPMFVPPQHMQPMTSPGNPDGRNKADAPADPAPSKKKAGKKSVAATAAVDGEPTGSAKPGPKKAGGKRKKQQDDDGGKFDEKELYVGNLEPDDLAFEQETDNAMEAVLKRRRQAPALSNQPQELHLLSDWRLAHEILRQRRDKASTAAAANSATDPGFDSSFLSALQLGFSALAGNVMRRAAAAARHRTLTAQRPPEFVVTRDARRGVGAIRRREEAAAEAKAAAEREALLKAAGSKRADEETRALAQKARAELAGQQQAAAANKALAATLGGRRVKWATAATQAGSKRKATKESGAAAEKGVDGGEDAGGDAMEGTGGLTASRSKAALAAIQGETGGGPSTAAEAATVSLADVMVALEQDPVYCRSTLLYRLSNGMVG